MEIKFYLRMMQRGWWLILISALAAVNFSLIYSYYLAVPMYEAVARFIVSPNLQNIQGRDIVNSLDTLDRRSIISTYAEVLSSPQIIKGTYELLHEDPESFSNYETSVTVLPDANILRLSVRGPDPQVAAMLANSIGQHAIDYVRDLYVVYNVDFLDQAVAPPTPYQPRPVQDAGLALLVGLVVGVALAIFRDALSGSFQGLSQRKMIDPESMALTRPFFERRVREELAAQPESVITIGFLYLNGIQEYYDSLPQAYINHIMRRVTETLKHQLRGNDVVGRWSQLQFSLLLPSTDAQSATRRLMRIREVLDQPFSIDSDEEFMIQLDPRIGLADRQGGESLQVLINQAEQALEISMQSGERINMYKVRPFG
ncbi:MAG: diguanylate cyclase [Chloroflexota bacterium]